MSEPRTLLCRAEGITRRFPDGNRWIDVLKGVDLELAGGELVAVVGRSGAGKSTLINLLGLLDRPTEGRLSFQGRDMALVSAREQARLRNHAVGMVFQSYHLLPDLSALENVALPARMGGMTWPRARERARQLLDRVGLSGREGFRPAKLSGGEKQRTALVRALVNDPVLVLCDEPTGNLDSQTADDILGLILEFNRSLGQTYLLVTHDREVARLATRRFELSDGRLVVHGEVGGT